jgi:TonB family protein
MNPDRTELVSGAISLGVHILAVILLSLMVVKQNPRQVALITDVTLIDASQYMGQKGAETKTVGTAREQKKIAETVKRSVPKKQAKTVKKTEAKQADVKTMLKKIEQEKSALDMGISREKLREQVETSESTENPERSDEEVPDSGVTAAGSAPVVTGALSARKYAKIDWRFPEKLPEETELAIEIVVMPSGIIKSVRLVRTAGYPELDRMALSQVRKLQFDPLPADTKQEDQMGVLLFKFGARR